MNGDRPVRAGEAIVRWGLLALIVYTPLAFGTVEAWAIALLEWGIWSLVLVEGITASLGGGTSAPRRRGGTGLEIPIALFVLLCVAQTVPLPISWLGALSPGSSRMYAMSAAPGATGLTLPAEATAPGSLLRPAGAERRPVSLNPHDTRERLLLLVSLAGLFLLVARWSAQPRRPWFLAVGVAVTGCVVSLFGLVQYLTWNGRIYWFRRVPSTSSFGPFVNHNHFAGYVGMIIPIAVCLAFSIAERRREPDPADEFAFDRWGRAGLALYGAVVLVVALFFSLSRGGILSSAIGGLALFFLVARRLDSKLLVWSTALMLIALAVGFIGWIGADVVSAQIGTYATMGNEASFQARWVIWDAVVENLGPFLWVGSGFGTFEEGFAPLTPPGSSRRWDRAHNDYLQLLWETGLVGALLFAAAAVIFIRRYWWPALRARGHGESLLRVGLAVSIMTIALHSVVDFNLQIGANGFLFALLAGLLVGLDRLHHARAAAAGTPREVASPAGTSVVADGAGSA